MDYLGDTKQKQTELCHLDTGFLIVRFVNLYTFIFQVLVPEFTK